MSQGGKKRRLANYILKKRTTVCEMLQGSPPWATAVARSTYPHAKTKENNHNTAAGARQACLRTPQV